MFNLKKSEEAVEEAEDTKMSPITLQQELNLSRRACCHRCTSAAPSARVCPTYPPTTTPCVCKKCFRCWPANGLLLVLLGVLLCSFPLPTYGRPNGTLTGLQGATAAAAGTAFKESQPNVSMTR